MATLSFDDILHDRMGFGSYQYRVYFLFKTIIINQAYGVLGFIDFIDGIESMFSMFLPAIIK